MSGRLLPGRPGRPTVSSTPGLPGLDRRDRRRALAALAVGVAGEMAAAGLLATGAWLLLSAALRPPILLLSVAIGAVQVFSLMRGFARYGERLSSHSLGLGLQAGLRAWLYRRLENLLPGGLPGAERGDLLSRLISDTEEAQDLAVRTAVPVVALVAAWAAATVAAALLLAPAGGILVAAGTLGIAGPAAVVFLAGWKASALPAARGAVVSWTLEMLAGGEELAALGAGDWALSQLADRERALGARTRAVAAATGLARAAALLAGGLGVAGVVWAGATAVRAGRIGPVELGVLVFLALSVAGLLQALPDALGRLPVSLAALDRLAGLGRVPAPAAGEAAGVTVAARLRGQSGHGPPDVPGTIADAAAGGGAARPRPVAALALRGAVVACPGLPGSRPHEHPRPAVSGLDLDLVPGRPVALAGPSGSGKTTVLLALLRFLDLAAGRMAVDGTDARDLPAERVRALMAWSPEQPVLFPTSVRANLRVGAPHATDGQIVDLLGRLRLGPWLDRLEAGLDTVLAPWAHPVSGGERQRLSVARAILAGRPVLLLDEATSHLDQAAASAVLAVVLEHAADRSLLWVTHRQEELAFFPEVRSLDPVPG